MNNITDLSPTPAEAHATGRTGANLPPELLGAERLAFESWAFHNGIAPSTWGPFNMQSESLRLAWIAWRDRAALAHHAAGGEAG